MKKSLKRSGAEYSQYLDELERVASQGETARQGKGEKGEDGHSFNHTKVSRNRRPAAFDRQTGRRGGAAGQEVRRPSRRTALQFAALCLATRGSRALRSHSPALASPMLATSAGHRDKSFFIRA